MWIYPLCLAGSLDLLVFSSLVDGIWLISEILSCITLKKNEQNAAGFVFLILRIQPQIVILGNLVILVFWKLSFEKGSEEAAATWLFSKFLLLIWISRLIFSGSSWERGSGGQKTRRQERLGLVLLAQAMYCATASRTCKNCSIL